MKLNILTIGASPYQLTSNGKIHGEIIRHLYSNGHGIVGCVWGHDVTYFLPEEEDGKKQYFYDCNIQERIHKIPIVPFRRGENEAIAIYEVLNSLRPDLVITVGDFNDFLFMKAVKSFYTGSLKWLFVMNNFTNPINEKNTELISDIDGILCINKFTVNLVREIFSKELIDQCYIGSTLNSQHSKKDGKFRLITTAKNCQSDNLPTIMRAVADVRDQIPEIELYCHSNVYDNGEYDLNIVKDRFDPKGEFITFPDKYVSLFDGISDDDLAVEFSKSHVYVSVPMVSSSGISCFDAISCGCIPILSKVGVYTELAEIIEKETTISKDNTLVDGCEIMSIGESYLYVTGYKELAKNILKTYQENIKGESVNLPLYNIMNNFSRDKFLSALLEMANRTVKSKEAIYLEPV